MSGPTTVPVDSGGSTTPQAAPGVRPAPAYQGPPAPRPTVIVAPPAPITQTPALPPAVPQMTPYMGSGDYPGFYYPPDDDSPPADSGSNGITNLLLLSTLMGSKKQKKKKDKPKVIVVQQPAATPTPVYSGQGDYAGVVRNSGGASGSMSTSK